MATNLDCELLHLPLDETTEPTSSAISTTPTNKDTCTNERSILVTRIRPCKPQCTSFCIKNKAALLILVWKFLFSLSLGVLLTPRTYLSLFADDLNVSFVAVTCGAYGSTAILFLFFPLAGFLADVKFGRYKVVLTTLWLVWLCLTISLPLVGVGILVHYLSHVNLMWVPITIGILAAMALFIGFVGFNANVIQFGLDQLHDAPSDDSSLFIHWYVWAYYLAASISKPVWSGVIDRECGITIPSAVVVAAIAVITVSILGVSLCFECCKKNWFLIDTGTRLNPYKLVYRVLKFAVKHKNPVRRSAFTFCEDELPSRIDFGKEKYGGPFSTEEVEDVKVFLGIFGVLLALGPTFATETATNALLPTFAGHLQNTSTNGCITTIIVDNGTLTPIFITVLIPTYLCLLRPFIRNYIPGIMKRMGLGMVFFLISLLCTFFVDTSGHIINKNATCFLSNSPGSTGEYIEINSNVLIVQSFLNSVGYMLLYIAAYEFICAQSPHLMKGLLIGVFFAINGLFHLLSIVGLFLPFTFWRPEFPSCGFGYYFVNIFMSIVGLMIFTYFAKQYRYRQRDEPSRIYIYAEEYYEKAKDEPNYDYDNYDNLNVETIQKH